MRHIIFGVGAVGGVVAGKLAGAGENVVGIARPAMAAAIRERGLRIETPDAEGTYPVPVVESIAALAPEADDVVYLAMKTQDTPDALSALRSAGFDRAAIVCLQNGVENERLALRRFARVYGICVMLPATYLEPGLVQCYSSPKVGILDVGRYPTGSDETAAGIAAALERAGFSSRPQADIMRWKYGKLLMNLGNALDAAIGRGPAMAALYGRARAEAEAVLKAAGIAFVGPEEDTARRADHMSMRPIGGAKHPGGSTWQSLARGTGSVETDYLNGEIALLGRLHGVPTPVNTALQAIAARMAASRAAPGSLSAGEIETLIAAA